jgi:hypothetical protein
MIAGSVSQLFQAGGGIGTDRLVSWLSRDIEDSAAHAADLQRGIYLVNLRPTQSPV